LDNLTHSLVGLLAAEGVVRLRERRGQRPLDAWSRSAIYLISVIGNNLPDLDFSYSRISGRTFGYLLQHRGYTHTVPAALLFALLMWGLTFVLAKRRAQVILRNDWWLFAAVALGSPLLHIAMDFGNNYGVHPLWPVYNGWFYGDAFFILEPSFWLVIIAPLAFSLRSRAIRVALWVTLAAATGALWYRPFVPRAHAVGFSVLTLGLLLLARKMPPSGRLLLSLGSFLLLVLAFVIGSRLAKGIVAERARTLFPGATTLDIVATPMPSNPFCWSVILVDRQAGRYWVRLGRVATFPAWLDADSCPYDRGANPTTPLAPLAVRDGNRLRLTDEYSAGVADLAELNRDRCEVRALLRFARVPYFTPLAPDRTRVVGDVRYDRHPDLDFADFRLPTTQGECPPHVPPWLPPRTDLLAP
jgi:inner membrane protein